MPQQHDMRMRTWKSKGESETLRIDEDRKGLDRDRTLRTSAGTANRAREKNPECSFETRSRVRFPIQNKMRYLWGPMALKLPSQPLADMPVPHRGIENEKLRRLRLLFIFT